MEAFSTCTTKPPSTKQCKTENAYLYRNDGLKWIQLQTHLNCEGKTAGTRRQYEVAHCSTFATDILDMCRSFGCIFLYHIVNPNPSYGYHCCSLNGFQWCQYFNPIFCLSSSHKNVNDLESKQKPRKPHPSCLMLQRKQLIQNIDVAMFCALNLTSIMLPCSLLHADTPIPRGHS